MLKILFNHRLCDKVNDATGDVYLPKNGSCTQPVTIHDMKRVETPAKNFIQMMDNGVRQGRDDMQWTSWNQCTYEDIDYKKYISANPYGIDAMTIYNVVCKYLQCEYSDILYYSEMSRSGRGFHFIFYFMCNRTESAWRMCKAISAFVIRQAFCACGYRDEFEWEGVWDYHTSSPYLPCFITKNECVIYEKCTGRGEHILDEHRYDIERQYNMMFRPHRKHDANVNNIHRDDLGVSFTREDISGYAGYYEHTARWLIFMSLSGLCGDDQERLDSEWLYVAQHIKPDNGHDTKFYERAPYDNDWNRKRTGREYIHRELLEPFGYKIIFNNLNDGKNKATEIKATKGVRKEKVYI